MRFDEAYSGNVFIGATQDWDAAQAVIYGMPMDWTVSFRPGSRFGPARVREVSLVLEEYSPYLRREMTEVKYYDAGDIPLPFGNPEKSVAKIGAFVDKVLSHGKIPFGLGGEHLVTWPVVREVYRHYPDLAVIHLDAHADLRTDYEGEALSHATPLRKIAELIGPQNVYQFGIRSGTKEEFEYAERSGIHFHPFDVVEPLRSELPGLKGRPVYVTVDIDVLDPAFAPGTGTPEPGGITSRELLEAIRLIARSDVRVVGADIVEVAPVYDPTEQTPVAAAKVLREMLIGFVK
ncbi:agmatinase [Polycladomyces sp. WAk]|uniref:Agmatinase n=1 Tax=Polycladomyces zharkentensis TaxID=2807616 RepID=A0ABS2WF06_9BACL|nr:agmatinase [Polycladomyces sp. WAk]MBN2908126.1 agmatinase [Polycladomyces sp. WAk]